MIYFVERKVWKADERHILFDFGALMSTLNKGHSVLGHTFSNKQCQQDNDQHLGMVAMIRLSAEQEHKVMQGTQMT